MQTCTRCLEGQMQWDEDSNLDCIQCGHVIYMDTEEEEPVFASYYVAIDTQVEHDLLIPHARPWITGGVNHR